MPKIPPAHPRSPMPIPKAALANSALSHRPGVIAEDDLTQYRICLCSVGVSCPACVSSQLEQPQPARWQGSMRSRKGFGVKTLRSSCFRHKYTIRGTAKKINRRRSQYTGIGSHNGVRTEKTLRGCMPLGGKKSQNGQQGVL